MKYDRLLNYIDRNGCVDLPTALTLMNEYSHVNIAYKELRKLVDRKVLERDTSVSPNVFRRRIKGRKITKPLATHPSYDNNLQEIAAFYRFLIRYGAQHFNSPGRQMMMDVMRTWLNERRDLIDFIERLRELLDNPPSHSVYLEIEKGLNDAGWYPGDYDAFDQVRNTIALLNPNGDKDFMDITEESWEELFRLDSLHRINRVEPLPEED